MENTRLQELESGIWEEVWGVEKHEKDVNQATQAIMLLIEAYLEELHVG